MLVPINYNLFMFGLVSLRHFWRNSNFEPKLAFSCTFLLVWCVKMHFLMIWKKYNKIGTCLYQFSMLCSCFDLSVYAISGVAPILSKNGSIFQEILLVLCLKFTFWWFEWRITQKNHINAGLAWSIHMEVIKSAPFLAKCQFFIQNRQNFHQN